MSKTTIKTPPVAGHTPGPWEVEDMEGCANILSQSQGAVCYLTGIVPEEENQTNGRLIAASPALLTACESLLKSLRIWVGGKLTPMEFKQVFAAEIAAIEKAKI